MQWRFSDDRTILFIFVYLRFICPYIMKCLIVFATAWLLSITAFAQETHLKFKGIPVDGNYKVFAEKLIQKGFKQIEASDDVIALTGNFMAEPSVTVVVYPDPASKLVTRVAALIDAGDRWTSIERKYYDVIGAYKEKYGTPNEHREEFPDEVYDDSIRLHRLEQDRCYYHSIWETEGGRIVVYLVYYRLNYYVVCSYTDEQNQKVLRQTILNDI